MSDIRKVIEFYAHTRHEYKLLKELEQQESDAELGQAVREAFEEGHSVMRDDGGFEEIDNDIVYEYDLKTIANNGQDLLEWARMHKEAKYEANSNN